MTTQQNFYNHKKSSQLDSKETKMQTRTKHYVIDAVNSKITICQIDAVNVK